MGDGTKSLGREQLKALLADYSLEVFERKEKVSEDEIDFLMKLCEKGRDTPGFDDTVHGNEILAACEAWFAYLERGPQINEFLGRFDLSRSGMLNEDEFRTFLTKELNNGREVSPEMIRWILREADMTGNCSLSKMELARAISIWY